MKPKLKPLERIRYGNEKTEWNAGPGIWRISEQRFWDRIWEENRASCEMGRTIGTAEDDQRLIGVKNNYGLGTHSYNHSAEKREMDRQRQHITAEYNAGRMKP